MNRNAIRIIENPMSGLIETSNMDTLKRLHPVERMHVSHGASTPFPKEYKNKFFVVCLKNTGEYVLARIIETRFGKWWIEVRKSHKKPRRRIQGHVIAWSEIKSER